MRIRRRHFCGSCQESPWITACLIVGLCLALGCGCRDKPKESLTKRAAKKFTNKAFDAVDGVTEVIAERGKKTAQTTTEAAGEVLAGAAEGGKAAMDQHGGAIGSNVVSAVAPVVVGAASEAEARVKSSAVSNLTERVK